MKLGFVSAILDGWSFEEMIDTAARLGYACVEVIGQAYFQLEAGALPLLIVEIAEAIFANNVFLK